jgi:hypothetical protein
MAEHEFFYEIYLNHTQDICILGRMESGFIGAPSYSTVSNSKRNQAAIEKIASGVNEPLSTAFSEYDEIKKNWYQLQLSQTRQNGTLLYHLSENPGGHFDRSFFADQISEIFGILSRTSLARLANQAYLPALRYYQEFLKQYNTCQIIAPDDCHMLKSVIRILENESYLKLSSNSVARNLYLTLAKWITDLRGGGLSDEIERIAEDELQTAQARCAGGTYLPVQNSYQEILSNYDRHSEQAADYYYEMKPLIGIVESESYLYSSSDTTARELYKFIARSASELYSAHMGTRG